MGRCYVERLEQSGGGKMNKHQSTVDNRSAEWDTNRMKDYGEDAVRDALRWSTDAEKQKRKKEGECRTCFYLRSGRIGGAAITSYPCGLCGEICNSGSTNCNKLCRACGDKYQLCTYCGSDIDLRVRRKFDLPKAVEKFACGFCAEFFDKSTIVLTARGRYCAPCATRNNLTLRT